MADDTDKRTVEPQSHGETPPQSSTWTEGEEVRAATPQEAPPPASKKPADPNWERDLIGRLTFATLAEQRRARRWGIFFKSLTFLYLFGMLYLFLPQDESSMTVGKKHTALIDIEGVIASDSQANADDIVTGLRSAFNDGNTAGIILRINSPGGSPVQAGYVNDEIKRLRAQHPKIPLYAVVSDICASGGYYIAVAADEIYADKASLVGSIGVLMDSFGFVGTMEKLGVERRLLTAGENKGFLDPFSPLKPADVDHVRKLLASTHQQFVNVVKEGRGDRLKDNPTLFTGLIWTGQQAMELGLIDGLGSSSYVAREIIKTEKIVNYTRKPHAFERFADRIGMGAASTIGKLLGLQAGAVMK